jgi:hypothetical protein
VEHSEELRMSASSPIGSVTGASLALLTLLFLYLMVFQPGS